MKESRCSNTGVTIVTPFNRVTMVVGNLQMLQHGYIYRYTI